MRVLIIHGTKGSPEGNWFPWLASEVEREGLSTMRPRLPTPEGQSLAGWRSAFYQQCGRLDASTILVGHSLGAVFALRLIEEIDFSIRATVLVAPPGKHIGIPEFDGPNSDFFATGFNLEKIKLNSGKLSVFISDNDPYIPQAHFEQWAFELGVEPKIVKGGGHLNSESGYQNFHVLLDCILKCK